QDLDRYRAPQPSIGRAIDLAHSPGTQQRLDLERTDTVPDHSIRAFRREQFGCDVCRRRFQKASGLLMGQEEGFDFLAQGFVVSPSLVEKGSPLAGFGLEDGVQELSDEILPFRAHERFALALPMAR